MVAQQLKIDPRIRDWVVLPLMFMAVMVNIFSGSIAVMMKSEPKPKMEEFHLKQVLARSRRIRMNSKWIGGVAFAMRKAFFCDAEKGLLHQGDLPPPFNPMQDPTAMMGGMTQNMKFFVNTIMIEVFVNYFFQGLVMLRMPFPLFNGFKMMNQRGVELTTLDPSFVSSMSWYFLVMFGSQQLLNIFRADFSEEAKQMKAQQAQLASMGAQMNFDATKAFAAEAKVMDLAHHTDGLADVEKRLLGSAYPKPNLLAMPTSSSGGSKGGRGAAGGGGSGTGKKKAT